MICSSLNRDLFILFVSFVGTNSTSIWRKKRVSGQSVYDHALFGGGLRRTVEFSDPAGPAKYYSRQVVGFSPGSKSQY